ncbi:hypothetical protein SUGI_0607440 [Cryptomeria japonica]|nr:hypothetical protein SUGI_0607440 [Cryptomeria japonica]
MRSSSFLLLLSQSPVPLREASINDSLTVKSSDSSGLGLPPVMPVDGNLNTFRPSLAVIIAVLVTMFSLTFLLLLYAKHCKQNAMAVISRDDRGSNLGVERHRVSGVDRAVVESLPVFKFSSLKGMKEGLECAVCLNAFEELEILRLLPKCKHAFHVECVDKWLDEHSSCPLCRHRVDPEDMLLADDITGRKSAASPRNSTDLVEDGIEFFVQRESEAELQRSFRSSSRFSIDRLGSLRRQTSTGMNIDALGSSRKETVDIGCLDKFGGSGRKDELLLAEAEMDDYERFVRRFSHRIIVSDVIFQRRWSDFKPSDLEFFDSKLLRASSSRRSDRNISQLPEAQPYFPHSSHGFESTPRHPGRRAAGASDKISKMKDEMERKRKLDKQAIRLKSLSSSSASRLEFAKTNKQSTWREDDSRGRLLDSNSPRRSMSEITSLDRVRQNRTANILPLVSKETAIPTKDEEMLKTWLSIARRTLLWFADEKAFTF